MKALKLAGISSAILVCGWTAYQFAVPSPAPSDTAGLAEIGKTPGQNPGGEAPGVTRPADSRNAASLPTQSTADLLEKLVLVDATANPAEEEALLKELRHRNRPEVVAAIGRMIDEVRPNALYRYINLSQSISGLNGPDLTATWSELMKRTSPAELERQYHACVESRDSAESGDSGTCSQEGLSEITQVVQAAAINGIYQIAFWGGADAKSTLIAWSDEEAQPNGSPLNPLFVRSIKTGLSAIDSNISNQLAVERNRAPAAAPQPDPVDAE